jgi:LacI family transcriptional regulator
LECDVKHTAQICDIVVTMDADERRVDRPEAGRRATMQHVAALANVSLKTVSRVINGEPGVSPVLSSQVLEAAERLGYRRNLTASNLRRGQRTASIGVLVQDLSNDFCGELLRSVEERARERGVVVMSASLDDEPDRERDLVAGLVHRRCDGLVLMPASADQSYLLPELLAGLKVVMVDRPPTNIAVDSVTVDNRGGASSAIAHLVRHGHRRIGCLVDSLAIPTATERLDGVRAALVRAGLTVDPALEHAGARTADEAADAVATMLDLADPPTAFFCGRNVISVGAVRALRSRGLQRQLALVGFDDFATADLLEPGLTTIRQDAGAEGRQAVDLLLARLDGQDEPARSVVLPTQLIERGSGELPGPAA